MRRLHIPRFVLVLLAVLLFSSAGLLHYLTAAGLQVTDRYLRISDSTAGATAKYVVGFDYLTSGAVGSLRVQFCSNSPLVGQPCTPPSGFDLSGATLTAQGGVTGYTIDPATTSNVLILTRTPFGVIPTPAQYELSGVINPDTEGSYYARVETFSSTDASGSHVDYGGLAYDINSNISITTTVPPYLYFCTGLLITSYDCGTATGDYVDFGELSTTQTRTGTSEIVLATNAGSGVSVSLDGTTMTSGNNVITALTASDVSRPGTAQFGLNLRKNTDPAVGQNPAGPGAAAITTNYGTPNRYRFVPGEQIVSTTGVSDLRKFTASYIVNVPHGQTPGIYVSSITYVCLASF